MTEHEKRLDNADRQRRWRERNAHDNRVASRERMRRLRRRRARVLARVT